MARPDTSPLSAPGSVEDVERRGDLEVLRLARLAELGADAVVTTRVGGVSDAPYDTLNLGDHVGDDPIAVAENRGRLAAAMGVRLDALAIPRQVHGTGVVIVRRGSGIGEADVLVTDDDTVAICVLVADCLPIVLLDPVARVLCVAHAGWRGIASRVPVIAVDAMAALGARPARTLASMGPCISQAAYQVGADVAAAFDAAGCGATVVPDGTGRHLADLASASRLQLLDAGLRDDAVALPTSWTDGGARCFSDRSQRPCGRFALAARLAQPAS